MITPPNLPAHLRQALGAWHTQPECDRLVAQLELYGLTVAVRRLHLGDMHSPAFDQIEEIYRTQKGTAPCNR